MLELSRDWWGEYSIKYLGRELRSLTEDELKELRNLINEELGEDKEELEK